MLQTITQPYQRLVDMVSYTFPNLMITTMRWTVWRQINHAKGKIICSAIHKLKFNFKKKSFKHYVCVPQFEGLNMQTYHTTVIAERQQYLKRRHPPQQKAVHLWVLMASHSGFDFLRRRTQEIHRCWSTAPCTTRQLSFTSKLKQTCGLFQPHSIHLTNICDLGNIACI